MKKYTVSELIEMLSKFPPDAIVAVKHRDEYGSCDGCEYDVEPYFNHDYTDKTVESGIVLI